MKWLNDQIILNNKQAISKLQTTSQNRGMHCWGINTANIEAQMQHGCSVKKSP